MNLLVCAGGFTISRLTMITNYDPYAPMSCHPYQSDTHFTNAGDDGATACLFMRLAIYIVFIRKFNVL